MTTIVSPNCGFNKRIPCRPIDPITVKAASSSEISSGTFATKFLGTQTYSAWFPLEATRSPTLNSVTPFPTATTRPTLQYPNGKGCPNLLKTASNVGCKPSVLILSNTCLTRSGCWRALSIRFAFPNSTNIRSVPKETSVRVVWINTYPFFTCGTGTSSRTVAPLFKSCIICFIILLFIHRYYLIHSVLPLF